MLKSFMTGLDDVAIGEGCRPYIIAEVAQAHDGSLGLAHAYIEAAASAGANAIKFQTHYASEESTSKEPWRVRFSYQDDSRYDYWERMEFTDSQWKGLKEHADRLGIAFLSTPFSTKAVNLLESIDVPMWKIGSGEINNTPLLKEISATGKPVILSSGMSSLSEIDAAVELLEESNTPYAVLQCTSSYPCPPDLIGLNNISFFKDRYNCPVGLSDHSGSPIAAIAAMALQASIIEVHIVFDKSMFGPDVKSSLTIDELSQVVKASRDIHTMLSSPVDKDSLAEGSMAPLRALFNKSIVLSSDLPSGTVLTEQHFSFKKPGAGMPPGEVNQLIGKVLLKDLPKDHFIEMSDVENG